MNFFALKKIILFLLIIVSPNLYCVVEIKYELSVAAIFQDEAPYLKEWIEYHQMLGVEHFYLYNNQSQDEYLKVLTPYIKSKKVTLIDWPNQPITYSDGKHSDWVCNTQAPAFYDAIKRAKNTSKWLAIIDLDEFIVPVKESSILRFLKIHDDASQIQIFWQAYGTSHVVDIPANALLIETLMWKCPPNHWLHDIPKTIIKPNDVLDFSWIPHRFNCKIERLTYKVPIEEMRINHYINRTIRYFYEYKIPKKAAMEGDRVSEKWIHDFINLGNDVEDRVMDNYIPGLRKRMNLKP